MLTVSKSYHYLRNIICFILVCVCHNFYAQTDLLFEAQRLCNEKKFDQAIPLIEKVIVHPDTKNDPASWHIRSYSYIQTYKLAGPANTSKINLLDTAIASAIVSKSFDKDKGYLENNNAFIKNGANTFYKISTILLQDSLNNVKSEEYYNKYKKCTELFDPTFDFKQQDIKYYNTTGSIFEDLYMRNNFNQKYGDVAKTALLKVLDIKAITFS